MAGDEINAEMAEHARAAAEIILAEYGRELDFSEPTIGAIEAILNGFWQDGNNTPETLTNAALLFGSYIGEMIRNCFPEATWVLDSKSPDAPEPLVRVGEIDLYPIGWCYKRMYNGPADNVVNKYLAFRKVYDERSSEA